MIGFKISPILAKLKTVHFISNIILLELTFLKMITTTTASIQINLEPKSSNQINDSS